MRPPLTLPQEQAGADVPVLGELGSAGAELHFADVGVDVTVPPGLATVGVAVEVEATEDEAGLSNAPAGQVRPLVTQAASVSQAGSSNSLQTAGLINLRHAWSQQTGRQAVGLPAGHDLSCQIVRLWSQKAKPNDPRLSHTTHKMQKSTQAGCWSPDLHLGDAPCCRVGVISGSPGEVVLEAVDCWHDVQQQQPAQQGSNCHHW